MQNLACVDVSGDDSSPRDMLTPELKSLIQTHGVPKMGAYSLSLNSVKNSSELKKYLIKNSWPINLADTFINKLNESPMCYVVIDDSSTMSLRDNELFDPKTNKISPCTRWAELCNTVRFQMNVADIGGVRSKFMFLNGSTYEFSTEMTEASVRRARSDANEQSEFATPAKIPQDVFNLTGGATPLCAAINKISDEIEPLKDWLITNNKTISVIIATDGEESDGNILTQINRLKQLPVHITLKLCANATTITSQYWFNLDEIQLLEGYVNEARKIYKSNPWLRYGLPLHQMREFGITCIEFNSLAKQILSVESKRKLSAMIGESKVYCTVTGTTGNWIHEFPALKKKNKSPKTCVIM